MNTKTQELTGIALDWAVAKCERFEPFTDGISWIIDHDGRYQPLPKYSTDWSEGGPIIEREKITLDYFPDGGHPHGGEWLAQAWDDSGNSIAEEQSETILIAAMRCYVASKLGNEVEVPDELL